MNTFLKLLEQPNLKHITNNVDIDNFWIKIPLYNKNNETNKHIELLKGTNWCCWHL